MDRCITELKLLRFSLLFFKHIFRFIYYKIRITIDLTAQNEIVFLFMSTFRHRFSTNYYQQMFHPFLTVFNSRRLFIFIVTGKSKVKKNIRKFALQRNVPNLTLICMQQSADLRFIADDTVAKWRKMVFHRLWDTCVDYPIPQMKINVFSMQSCNVWLALHFLCQC